MSGDTGVSDSDRNLIFICYSRADITSRVDIRDMLEKRLSSRLAFEHQPMRIEVFSDEQIKTGADCSQRSNRRCRGRGSPFS